MISSARGDEHLRTLRTSLKPYASLPIARALGERASEVARHKATYPPPGPRTDRVTENPGAVKDHTVRENRGVGVGPQPAGDVDGQDESAACGSGTEARARRSQPVSTRPRATAP